MTQLITPGASDVLAVWTGSGFVQDAIRIGDVLEGKPAVANHVVGITHQDKNGRWMGLEGRPGGFGLVDVTPYLSDPRTRSNHFQPRTPQQADQILVLGAKLTGTPYDWLGIDEDFVNAVHLDALSSDIDRASAAINDSWGAPGLLPGHVVCSSAWDWVYAMVSPVLAHPATVPARDTTPGDWWGFNDQFPQR